MPRNTRFNISKSDIISYLEDNKKNIYTLDDISEILKNNRDTWRLAKRLTVKEFINLLIKNSKFQPNALIFPHYSFTRYSWGEANLILILNSLLKRSYLSHYTAVYLHGLTEQIPKNFYINVEQTEKRKQTKSTLEQGRIDWAFKRKQRETNNIAIYQNYRICILNGKNTNNLGVINTNITNTESASITNIERTLIDIIVRPNYSGGFFEILKAYQNSAGKISVNKMAAMLKKLDYVYPYHQAIGFLLEKSGKYTKSQIEIFKQFEIKFDFYLTYRMNEMEYSKEWKLYYPKGI